jgi:hypothetical protein
MLQAHVRIQTRITNHGRTQVKVPLRESTEAAKAWQISVNTDRLAVAVKVIRDHISQPEAHLMANPVGFVHLHLVFHVVLLEFDPVLEGQDDKPNS